MSKTELRVIQGGSEKSEELLQFPQFVRGRAPENAETLVNWRISRGDLLKAAGNFRRQKVLDFWSMVAGKNPPIRAFGMEQSDSLVSLADAVACYQGLRRPCGDDDNGDERVIFILNPLEFFEYQFRPPIVHVNRRRVPSDLVFAAYARLDLPSEGGVRGVVTHWEFLEACPVDGALPIDHGDRYRQLLWRRA